MIEDLLEVLSLIVHPSSRSREWKVTGPKKSVPVATEYPKASVPLERTVTAPPEKVPSPHKVAPASTVTDPVSFPLTSRVPVLIVVSATESLWLLRLRSAGAGLHQQLRQRPGAADLPGDPGCTTAYRSSR